MSADFASFLAGRGDGSSATPDIARLVGARFVCASEVSPDQRFNPARLKSLTGQERIVARRLYRDPITFLPAFTPWLVANERPSISADDTAAWRRIKLLPLTNVIPPERRDPALKRALTTDPIERAAVLAWIIAGSIAWHQDGLGTCAAVEAATDGYRTENDLTGAWLRVKCTEDATARTRAAELYSSYLAWCSESEQRPLSMTAFGTDLKAKGVPSGRESSGVWYGLALTTSVGMHGSAGSTRDFPIRARIGDSLDDRAQRCIPTQIDNEDDAR